MTNRSLSKSGLLVIALIAGLVMALTSVWNGTPLVLAANPSADLDQCANDPAPSPNTNGCATAASDWVNGNLGASKSVYLEGDSIPYRIKFDSLPLTSHTVDIEWDTSKSGKHAIDYLTTFNRTVTTANPCLGVTGCNPLTFDAENIPADPQVTGAGVTPIAGNFQMYGGNITAVSAYSYPDGAGFAGDKSARVRITFTATVANPVLAWGGHIATRQDWGPASSAVSISGSPYHTRLISLDGSGGNQDRSLSAEAVIFPASITIIKDATLNGSTSFPFTASPSPLTNFSLVDNGTSANTRVFSGITNFTNYTVTETPPTGWNLTNRSCVVASGTANGGTQTNSGSFGVTINLAEGEQVTCTFANSPVPAPHLSITKTATEANYNEVGDVIHYTIVATNDGNTTLAAVTVVDPKLGTLSCTPANGSALNAGASMTCTGSHTVTQADIDAGHYDNTACVDDGPNGAAQACDSEDVPSVKSPHLAITKVAPETSYDAVGDVIHYTIVATNDGNTTLSAVTVTDPKVSGLSCAPANGSSLAPGASMTCTATHTVTQADIDAGHYANTACVDDGSGGAAQACASEDVIADTDKELAITKVATESSYDSVGDVIHYTITVTNVGNTTLGAVTVTDPKVTGLTCTPANGSPLAPNERMTCTATHTVTQADIDAGHYDNTACADDGANGAARVCDSEDVPALRNPDLSISKVAQETSYDSVGDTIHYTIIARNEGNTTLTSVTVSDPSVSGLSCTPANGSSLAPGTAMTCTATHTVTQADIDAGHYANTACADDGAGGADSVCDDADVPATENPRLDITKVATEESYDSVGDVIHYTIVATNVGNVTLDAVTVTDPSVSNLVCTPANGSSLAPGASLNCTASHTVTQTDINAGHYANTACVDDGAGGAIEDCANEDVPADQSPRLAITKDATEQTYDSIGDVINYTITATNTGNVTLTNVTVTDPNVSGLSCTPVNGSTLAPNASMTCSASHTVTQVDIDAGHYANTACVDDGPEGAAEVCDSEDVPADQNPHLSITKTAREMSYDAVGDVISYLIVATNDGNVTLANVTVTDPNVSNLVCSPANGSPLAPGASMTCSASHMVTQDDIDAGHYANTACVDDGPEGAAQACDPEDVPARENPRLDITKVATEENYDSVGDVIHYTIVATNTGNVTLDVVTVTDPKVSGLDCTPVNGSSLAPGASITCTATHEVTQADLNAGSYANTACVDDGDGGAAQDCADETVPAVQNPHLAITKVATEESYDSVGDVIHYAIVATNDGNVTLTNVTVTDANVSNLSCTPANGSTLAPGASLSCTATHTITQADIDAGRYANTACVDDGVGGAAQACAPEVVPADRNPELTLVKTATPLTYDQVGDVIGYSYLVTNTGNVSLAGPVTVTDDKATVTCPAVSTVGNGDANLNPGESITCSASYTIVAADITNGTVTNTATAHAAGTDSNQDDETVSAVAPPQSVGQIAPTATTCAAFRDGTAAVLSQLNYSVKNGKISQVDPGVFFYWVRIDDPGTYVVTQAITSGNFSKKFSLASGSAVFDSNCRKVTTISTQLSDGSVRFTMTGTGPFYVGIKYNAGSVKGQSAPSPTTVHYDFAVTGQANTTAGLDLVKK